MNFQKYLDESTLTTNIDINPIAMVCYNDFPGFMGGEHKPVPMRSPEYGDKIMQQNLKHLKDKKLYSKDIQNIVDINKYNNYMNKWKEILDFNLKNKNKIEKDIDGWEYSELYPKIKRYIRENSMNSQKIDLFLLEAKQNNEINYKILRFLNMFLADVNKIRMLYLDNIELKDDYNFQKYLREDLLMIMNAHIDETSKAWKNGSKTTYMYSYTFDFIDLLKSKDIFKENKKFMNDILGLLKSIVKTLGYMVDLVNKEDFDKKNIIIDLKVLTKLIKNKTSSFWTMNRYITASWNVV